MHLSQNKPYKLKIDPKTQTVFFYRRNAFRNFFRKLLSFELSQSKITIGTTKNILKHLRNTRHLGKAKHVSIQLDSKTKIFQPEIKRSKENIPYYRVAKNDSTVIIDLNCGTVSLLKPKRLKNIYNSIRGFDPEYTHVSCGHFEEIIEELTNPTKKT